MLPSARARPLSQRIMTRLRYQRSTSAHAGRQSSTYVRLRSAVSRPACAGECVTASMSRGKASCETCVPIEDTPWPLTSKRKSRLRHNGSAGGACSAVDNVVESFCNIFFYSIQREKWEFVYQ